MCLLVYKSNWEKNVFTVGINQFISMHSDAPSSGHVVRWLRFDFRSREQWFSKFPSGGLGGGEIFVRGDEVKW